MLSLKIERHMILTLKFQAMPLIRYEQVGENHCSHICKNGECLHGNWECDGNSGCPDEADEVHCIRAKTVKERNKILKSI